MACVSVLKYSSYVNFASFYVYHISHCTTVLEMVIIKIKLSCQHKMLIQLFVQLIKSY